MKFEMSIESWIFFFVHEEQKLYMIFLDEQRDVFHNSKSEDKKYNCCEIYQA